MSAHRSTLALALLLSLLLLPRPASAFGVSNIILRKSDLSSLETEYFNQARCKCNGSVQVEIQLDLSNKPSGQRLAVVAGLSCLDETTKAIKANCAVLIQSTLISELVTNPILTVPAQSLMGTTCSAQQSEAWAVFVYISDPADQTKWSEAKRQTITVDTQPPDPPTVNGIVSGEASVKVNFTAAGSATGAATDSGVSTQQTNIKGYQVLCEKIDGTQALGSAPAPAFQTTATLCPGTSVKDAGVHAEAGATVDARPQDAAPRDLAVKEASAPLDSGVEAGARDSGPREARTADSGGPSTSSCAKSLSAACVCSEITSSGTAQVKGLVNGQNYRFYLVAIDQYRNPSTPVLAGEATPQPVEDLWKRYKKAGGRSDGGFCFVATAAYGSYDHPQVRILRGFRDEVLLPSALGRVMVGAYYRAGEAPAAWLERHGSMRPLARAGLWPVTLVAAGVLYTSPGQKLLALSLLPLGLALLVLRGRGKRGGGR